MAENEVQVTTQATAPAAQSAPTNPLDRLIKAEMPNGIVVKTRCKLCNCPFRSVAEAMFDEGKTLMDIKTFLDGKGTVISIQNINCHMRDHFRDAARLARLAEYADSLCAIRERRNSRRETLEMSNDINAIELARVLTLETSGIMEKEKDRTDMIQKIQSSIRETIKTLELMEDTEDQVKAVQEKFIQVWRHKIEEAKDEKDKQKLIGMLTEFKQLLSQEAPK